MRDWNSLNSMSVFSMPKCFQHTYEGLKQFWKWNISMVEIQFSAYLWGIETTNMEVKNEHQIFPFSAYLWGIETFPLLKKKTSGKTVFSIPMRDWNRGTSGRKPHFRPIVFSIPMRDWNRGTSGRNPHFRPMFSAYLWGIETQVKRFQAILIFGFSAYLWGIETIKTPTPQLGQGMFSAYLWGIETLHIFQRFVQGFKVFSIPMRDWNPDGAYYLRWKSGFSAYLWGIETSIQVHPGMVQCKFSAYLWGIETPNGFWCFIRRM